MKLSVAIGADHAGLDLKNELYARFSDDYDLRDLGAHQFDPDDDYPDFAEAVAGVVAAGEAERGIIICSSGVGACIAANKVPGVRACLCHDSYSSHQGVEHDGMNVLCIGAAIVGLELATELVNYFLNARFSDSERHRRRRDKVLAIERRYLKDNPG
jgi:ribose 5-phosphate isomerase B